MKAAVLHELGKAPKFEEFDEPQAGRDEVLLRVRAAALKPVDRQLASGTHFASPQAFPIVCGTDGVGERQDGTRVLFGGPRRPFGAMAEQTVVPGGFCFPLPEEIRDETAAALANPGVSAWVSLNRRGKLAAGETVLVLGATGVTGQLAVQIAKLLGASRVVGVGRNEKVLAKLAELGADATIQLDQSPQALEDAYLSEIQESGFDVIIDYLWGAPAEGLLGALRKRQFAFAGKETRFVQAGESAGATIVLSAGVLRSAPVTILGTAGMPPLEILTEAMRQVMARGASGELQIATEPVALSEVERAWYRDNEGGRRVVVLP